MCFRIVLLLIASLLQQHSVETSQFELQRKTILSGDVERQERALRRIWITGNGARDEPLIQAIKPLLNSKSADLRCWACRALPRVGAKPELLLPLCKDKEADVRSAAAWAYFDTGGELESVRFLFDDKDTDVRATAAYEYLEAGGDPKEVVSLFDDSAPRVRRRVADAFVRFNGDPESVVRLLADKDLTVRKSVISSLLGRSIVEPVLPFLDDPEEKLRTATISGMVMGVTDPKYFRHAMKSQHREIRAEAALALLSKREIPIADVIRVLSDEDGDHLASLLATLDENQRKDVMPLMQEKLKSNHRWTRELAQETLGAWGIATLSAEEARKGLSDSDTDVCVNTIRALRFQPYDLRPFVADIASRLNGEEGFLVWPVVAMLIESRGVSELVDPLRDFMRQQESDDADAETECYIARTILRVLPDDHEAWQVLERHLVSADKSLRVSASTFLFNSKPDPKHIVRLAPVLKKSMIGPTSDTSASFSRSTLGRAGEAIAPTIRDWLAEPDLKVQHAAIQIAGGLLENKETVTPNTFRVLLPEITRLCRSRNLEIRELAFRVLMVAHESLGSEHTDGIDVKDIQLLAVSWFEHQRQLAAAVLGMYQSNSPKTSRELLKKLRRDRSVNVRAAAYLASTRLDVEDRNELVRELIEMLAQAEEEQLPGWIVDEALKQSLNFELVRDELLELVESGRLANGEQLLASIGRPVVPTLLERLSHEDISIRRVAARTLGLIGDPEFAHPLFRLTAISSTRDVALESLLQLREVPSTLADPLIELTRTELARNSPWGPKAEIRLLGKLGPAAARAIPLLAREQFERTEEYTGGDADIVPKIAVLVATTLARIEPNKEIGLIGFRKILTQTANGRSWLYDDDIDAGFEMTVDAIVELGDRSRPLIPKLAELAESPGRLVHPGYRGMAAYALSKLQPEKVRHWTELGRKLRNRLSRYHSAWDAIGKRFGFDDSQP